MRVRGASAGGKLDVRSRCVAIFVAPPMSGNIIARISKNGKNAYKLGRVTETGGSPIAVPMMVIDIELNICCLSLRSPT